MRLYYKEDLKVKNDIIEKLRVFDIHREMKKIESLQTRPERLNGYRNLRERCYATLAYLIVEYLKTRKSIYIVKAQNFMRKIDTELLCERGSGEVRNAIMERFNKVFEFNTYDYFDVVKLVGFNAEEII